MNEYDLLIPERGLVAQAALNVEVTVYVPSARLESENELLFPFATVVPLPEMVVGIFTFELKMNGKPFFCVKRIEKNPTPRPRCYSFHMGTLHRQSSFVAPSLSSMKTNSCIEWKHFFSARLECSCLLFTFRTAQKLLHSALPET